MGVASPPADYADDAEYQQVREHLLIEGLMDAVSLGEVHTAFMFEDHEPKRPLQEAQELTLTMIRDLVANGLFALGVPSRRGEFESWTLPLDAAMTKIEEAYVQNFDDRWGWTSIVWLNQTETGKELAEELYRGDNPENSGS